MRRLLSVLFAVALLEPCFGQSFDRLVLRPRSLGGGSYETAILKFCGADGWPTPDPECVGLRAPSTVTRYNLYLPIAAPVLPSCIAVNSAGQMSFVACGAGSIQLNTGDAILPADNPARWSRTYGGGAAAAGAYVELLVGVNDHAMWTFNIPAGFTNQPTLKVWGEAGTSDEYEASMRCVEPNTTDDWNLHDFDSPNEGTWLAPGVSGLNEMLIVLSNNDDMEDGDMCQLDLTRTAGSNVATWYHLEIN